MAEYRHYAQPHPHWADFPKSLPPGTKYYGMNRERKPVQPQEGLDIGEFDVSARDDYAIRVRSYRKNEGEEQLPVLVYLHGGGYVSGSLETDDALCRCIAAKVSIIVLNVEYRLAPENPFPVGFEDCFDVVRWVASSSGQASLNANLSKGFLLGGTSAGGNFTSGISHLAVQEDLSPPITGLLFMASSFCNPDVIPGKWSSRILSVNEINDAPGLTAKSIRYFSGKYGAPPDDKRFSPLLFKSNANIARKAVFQICGWDPRRDEAILFNELLQAERIETREHIYSGLPHGFWTTAPTLPESEAAIEDSIKSIAWLLQ